jgi:hypothetical protein
MALALALAGLAYGTAPAHGQMVMGISTNTAVAGSSSNSIDVTLTNEGGSAVTIAGFQFEITAASSGVNFTDVQTGTLSTSYIFGVNSAFGPDITLPNSMSGNYGQTISAEDNYSVGSAGASIGAGQTVGLGNVIFALSANTPVGSNIGITFNSSYSSLNDPSSNNVAVSFASSQSIGPTAVPELPPAALIGIGLFVGAGVQLRRHGLAGLRARLGMG